MQRFNSLLAHPTLSALKAHKQVAEFAHNIWQQIAPENLAALSHATQIKNQQLTISAINNAVAAKIKLFVPSLLIQLQNRGYEVTAIRVKVQVKSTPEVKPKVIKKLSSKAAEHLNTLADNLTGTELGDALAKLAQKARQSS